MVELGVRQESLDFSAIFGYWNYMAVTVDLQQMTVSDKICLMEAIWHDLTVRDSEFASPEWHGDVLAERDKALHPTALRAGRCKVSS